MLPLEIASPLTVAALNVSLPLRSITIPSNTSPVPFVETLALLPVTLRITFAAVTPPNTIEGVAIENLPARLHRDVVAAAVAALPDPYACVSPSSLRSPPCTRRPNLIIYEPVQAGPCNALTLAEAEMQEALLSGKNQDEIALSATINEVLRNAANPENGPAYSLESLDTLLRSNSDPDTVITIDPLTSGPTPPHSAACKSVNVQTGRGTLPRDRRRALQTVFSGSQKRVGEASRFALFGNRANRDGSPTSWRVCELPCTPFLDVPGRSRGSAPLPALARFLWANAKFHFTALEPTYPVEISLPCHRDN